MSEDVHWSDPAKMDMMLLDGVLFKMIDGYWLAEDGRKFVMVHNSTDGALMLVPAEEVR